MVTIRCLHLQSVLGKTPAPSKETGNSLPAPSLSRALSTLGCMLTIYRQNYHVLKMTSDCNPDAPHVVPGGDQNDKTRGLTGDDPIRHGFLLSSPERLLITRDWRRIQPETSGCSTLEIDKSRECNSGLSVFGALARRVGASAHWRAGLSPSTKNMGYKLSQHH